MKTALTDAALLVTTSWDDGHPSDSRVADLLEKHRISGTFYIPSNNSEGRPVMRSADIVEIGSRFEIGGHTQDHFSLIHMERHLAESQIYANKLWLEDILGREIGGFAYVRGHHNSTVRRLTGQVGFRYARTVKNLMSTPGSDRFRVPTTVQFFPHKAATYLRNYISGGPTVQRTGILANVLRESEFVSAMKRVVEACAGSGGYFHLWGHSWELDEHDLWNELDSLLGWLGRFPARFVTNAEWCDSGG